MTRRRRLRSSWLSLARGIPHGVGDFPLRGKMSATLTKGLGKNVGVADKGEGHPLNRGQAATLAKRTNCNKLLDEKQTIRCPPHKNKTVWNTKI